MTEIWRDIDGYDGLYQVSNLGRVRRLYKHTPLRILKPQPDHKGYLRISLSRDDKIKTCKVHRLVATAFVPNPDGKPQVNHINGDKSDNRAENLEWCTASENANHAVAWGLQKSGENSPQAKLTNEQARYVRDNPDDLTQQELADKFGVCRVKISQIQRGITYADAGGKIRKPKPKAPRTPDEIRERIRAEYKFGVYGHGTHALSKRFGINVATVWNIVREN